MFVDAHEMGLRVCCNRLTQIRLAEQIQRVLRQITHKVAHTRLGLDMAGSSRHLSICKAVDRLTPCLCINSRTDGMRSPTRKVP